MGPSIPKYEAAVDISMGRPSSLVWTSVCIFLGSDQPNCVRSPSNNWFPYVNEPRGQACRQACRHAGRPARMVPVAEKHGQARMQASMQACKHAGMQASRHAGKQAANTKHTSPHPIAPSPLPPSIPVWLCFLALSVFSVLSSVSFVLTVLIEAVVSHGDARSPSKITLP